MFAHQACARGHAVHVCDVSTIHIANYASGAGICYHCTNRKINFCARCYNITRDRSHGGLCQECVKGSAREKREIICECDGCSTVKNTHLSMFNLRMCEQCDTITNKKKGVKTKICKKSHDKCENSCAKCCFCYDTRPYLEEGKYCGYIDGVGYVMNKNRWDFYCRACKARYDKVYGIVQHRSEETKESEEKLDDTGIALPPPAPTEHELPPISVLSPDYPSDPPS
jgi:hypothetical protein